MINEGLRPIGLRHFRDGHPRPPRIVLPTVDWDMRSGAAIASWREMRAYGEPLWRRELRPESLLHCWCEELASVFDSHYLGL